jgi:hypothetical protein
MSLLSCSSAMSMAVFDSNHVLSSNCEHCVTGFDCCASSICYHPVRTYSITQPPRTMHAYMRDDALCKHPVSSQTLQKVGRHPLVHFVLLMLITWSHTDSKDTPMSGPSDDHRVDSTVYALVKRAIVLETNYKEMLHQGEEIDLRIKLWRDAIDICKSSSESMSLIPV